MLVGVYYFTCKLNSIIVIHLLNQKIIMYDVICSEFLLKMFTLIQANYLFIKHLFYYFSIIKTLVV